MAEFNDLYDKFEEIYAQAEPVFKRYEFIRIIALVVAIILEIGLAWFLYKAYLFTGRVRKGHIIIIIIMFLIWRLCKKNVEYFIKEEVMKEFLKPFGNLQWDMAEEYIKQDELKTSKIIPAFNELWIDDCFKGCPNNSDSELIISEIKTKNGADIFKVTNFNGAVAKFQITKHFSGHTVIRPKNTLPIKDLKPVKLEDPEWEKQFNVYSNDQVEARYLITPMLMERIKSLQKIYSAKSVSISFRYGTVMVAMDIGHDLFETCSLIKPIATKSDWKVMFFQIYEILKLRDILNTML